MKTNYFKLLVTVSIILLCLASCFGAKSNSPEEQIIKTIKEFYTAYIDEVEKMPINKVEVNALKEKYCTTELLNRLNIKNLDYDPFINAQDISTNLKETLTIKKDNTVDNVYVVSYKNNYSGTDVVIKLSIVMDDESYKIEDIW